MSAFRVELTDPLYRNEHDVRDIEAETMQDAISAVEMIVRAKHPDWRTTRAWLIERPLLHPVDADEIEGTPA